MHKRSNETIQIRCFVILIANHLLREELTDFGDVIKKSADPASERYS